MPRIFIVDDSISVRKALEITFKRHELDSYSAVSAEAALEILQGTPTRFDLLMADVIMPGMSGLELCSALRQQPRFEHLPVILMSGNVDDGIRQQARLVGANGVLRKPFSPDELMPMVEQLLGDAEPAAATVADAQAAAPDAPVPLAAPAVQETAITEVAQVPDAPMDVPDDAPADELAAHTAAAPVEAPASQPEPAPDAVVATEVVSEAAPLPSPIPVAPDPLTEVKQLVGQYRRQPGVEDVLVLDPEYRMIFNTGGTLAQHLPAYAKYFTTTAMAIGQHLMGDELQTITLQYRGRSVTYHVMHGYCVVVLFGASKTLN